MVTMITSKNATHAWCCWICCLAIITRPVQPFSAVADGISRRDCRLRSLPETLETLVQDTLDSDRKIVVVTGGVLSGIGKGVTASSIGVVSVIKYFGMFSLLSYISLFF